MRFAFIYVLLCILGFIFGVGLGITVDTIIPNLITSIF